MSGGVGGGVGGLRVGAHPHGNSREGRRYGMWNSWKMDQEGNKIWRVKKIK